MPLLQIAEGGSLQDQDGGRHQHRDPGHQVQQQARGDVDERDQRMTSAGAPTFSTSNPRRSVFPNDQNLRPTTTLS